jgi:hypothetical protein
MICHLEWGLYIGLPPWATGAPIGSYGLAHTDQAMTRGTEFLIGVAVGRSTLGATFDRCTVWLHSFVP